MNQSYSIREDVTMSTICADELLNGPDALREDRPERKAPVRPVRVTTADTDIQGARRPATRKRFEDFEVRSSGLGDLLGGQVFPRVF